MPNHLNGDLLLASNVPTCEVIRARRLWQHRHEIDVINFRPRSNRRRVLAAGTFACLLCAFFYAQPIATPAVTLNDEKLAVPATTTVATVGSTKLQGAVDVAPASSGEIKSELPSLPVVAIPTRRPVPAVKRAAEAGGATGSKAELTAGVARFDQCKPRCEAQHPLISSSSSSKKNPVAVTINTQTEEKQPMPSAVFDGARFVLVQTAVAPLTALRVGRDALGKMAGLN
ncbi:hypothetical protein LAV84_27330 [Rhizobium sp. VS19-DR104.2]|uniref:hypothetical protein n=1 Tax=unclassified Rhizobium TaxID=2613769 RepID=UPI001C5A9A36|nr:MULTISPECIES: hypothetical protein [unclassified Rhizobium]MBZ5763274.1 hypothetical protein [Rhizobium sp. VS19-DR96]MBZ5769379.1 hypothetical protein [Rhizobium sp. VS19-DR129.2]MBZ5776915.1 hypothetical protein [Rhizobium sp. VS19-DRK62.2]MBZ5787855.1 hypothetical protein [Rhizobium sp. VS19-DR121]MBZ5805332.1 hypothetical protein [Rhizobium sp. VS19-DR181]